MELRTFLLVVGRKRCLILTAFLATLLATVIFTFLQTPVYEATSTFVISPTGTYRDAESLAGVLDAMSRRAELANTYAEVAASRSIKQQAIAELGLSEAQKEDLSIESRLLAGTNVLEIKVQGSDASLVALFADEIGALTANYTRTLYEAYGLKPLDMADLPKSPVQPNKLLNLTLGVALGLALGLGLAFLAYYLEVPQQEPAGQSYPGSLLSAPQERAAVTPQPSRLGKARWILVGLLALAVIGTGSTLFLSGPPTAAAVLPSTRPISTFVPAAVWTPTPPVMPTDTALPALPAPVLLAPADGADLTANREIVLSWQPVPGLPPDAYYAITVAYTNLGRTWYDELPWTRDTSWTLSKHAYLLDLSDNGQFSWSVQVVRQVEVEAGSQLAGQAISDPSESRMLTWRLPFMDDGSRLETIPAVP